MKKLTKELSKREKIMLAGLVVILLGVGWFKLVYEPVNNQIYTINQQAESEQAEIDSSLVPLVQMRKMEKTIEEYKAEGKEAIMPFFDNSKELLVKLNSVMKSADEYSIDFGDAVKDDYLINRAVKLTFSTNTYKQARQIIDKLNEETYINQISDVSIEIVEAKEATEQTAPVEGKATVALTITFFEVQP